MVLITDITERVFEGLKTPKKLPLSPSQLAKRRVNQTLQLLFSDRYKNKERLIKSTLDYYSDEQEVAFYSDYSLYGLHQNEEEALEFAFGWATSPKVLVVGCGAGREAFAIEKEYPTSKIFGIDISASMIDEAKKNNFQNKIEFLKCEAHELNDQYDMIWVTALLESHIQGSANRISFYRTLRELCNSTVTPVIFTPQIRKLHWKTLAFWSSVLLRLRWLGQKRWEVGDVLLSNLGAHNIHQHLVYSHFYPTEEHFKNELRAGGFSAFRKMPQESWVVY